MSDSESQPKVPQYDFGDINRLLREAHGDFISVLYALNSEHVFKPTQVETEDGPKTLITQFLTGDNRRFFSVRDSTFFRAQGVMFHVDLLEQFQSMMTVEVDKSNPLMPNSDLAHKLYDAYSTRQIYVMEDILFHASSLLDYIANLTLIVLLGENSPSVRWKKFLGRCRRIAADSSKVKNISEHIVAAAILDANSTFIDNLYTLRSETSHNRMLQAGGSVSYSFKEHKSKILIRASDHILKSRILDSNYDWSNTELYRIGQYVTLQTLCHATSIISELRKDATELNRTKFIPEFFAHMDRMAGKARKKTNGTDGNQD